MVTPGCTAEWSIFMWGTQPTETLLLATANGSADREVEGGAKANSAMSV